MTFVVDFIFAMASIICHKVNLLLFIHYMRGSYSSGKTYRVDGIIRSC